MWTLKGELEARCMTVEDACKECHMDLRTMEILVQGGQTLPTLALKVAEGLKLRQYQAKHLGKALDATKWPKRKSKPAWEDNYGLPTPAPLDIDPEWWKKVSRK